MGSWFSDVCGLVLGSRSTRVDFYRVVLLAGLSALKDALAVPDMDLIHPPDKDSPLGLRQGGSAGLRAAGVSSLPPRISLSHTHLRSGAGLIRDIGSTGSSTCNRLPEEKPDTQIGSRRLSGPGAPSVRPAVGLPPHGAASRRDCAGGAAACTGQGPLGTRATVSCARSSPSPRLWPAVRPALQNLWRRPCGSR